MITIVLFLLAISFFIIARSSNNDEIWIGWGIAIEIILIILNTWAYLYEINQEANYQVLDNKINIMYNQAEVITSQLKIEVSKYEVHEKETFESITPQNLQFFWVKYPELKSAETVKSLMEQIGWLYKSANDYKMQKEDLKSTFIWFNMQHFFIVSSSIK